MPDTIVSARQEVSHLILTKTLWGRICCYTCFAELPKAQNTQLASGSGGSEVNGKSTQPLHPTASQRLISKTVNANLFNFTQIWTVLPEALFPCSYSSYFHKFSQTHLYVKLLSIFIVAIRVSVSL